MYATASEHDGRRSARRLAATLVLSAAALAMVSASALAQTPIDPQTLAELRSQYAEAVQTTGDVTATRQTPKYGGVATLSGNGTLGGGPGGSRGVPVELYTGIQDVFGDNGYWLWTISGSEVVYWALDDGTMGPVGGEAWAEVTEYQFSFAVHFDAPLPDTLRPYVVVSFYNAPDDPVGDATNPVVEPPVPVSSIGWIFDPITEEDVPGFYVLGTGLIDLLALGLDFDLNEDFYVEILPLEWSSYPDGAPVPDPDVHAVFTGPGSVTCGSNQDHMWSDFWVLQGGCDPAVHLINGDYDGYYDHPAERYDGGCWPYLNQSPVNLRGLECPDSNVLELSTEPDEEVCVGDPVTVTLSMSCIPGLVRGYQAFLEFDVDALTFVSGTYTASPFGLHIIDPIVAAGGNIDLAAGIDDLTGQEPTSTSAVLATLNFVALDTGTSQVEFRTHDPPTRLSDQFGQQVVPFLVDSPTIVVDMTPPVITCPADITVNADAGGCTAVVTWTAPTATDECDPDPVVVCDPPSGSTFGPGGPTVVTCTATDAWGNSSDCTFNVTVSAYNELVVDVDLAWPFTGTRCITFELWDCDLDTSEPVEQVLTFSNGLATAELVLVPCFDGFYDCITARDWLHTLRRTIDPLGTSGTQYVAAFTVANNKELIGGNLNDDFWIDILDFGVFSSQWGVTYAGGGNTTCTTAYPHADIAFGTVPGLVGTEDFTFIQINFLQSSDDNCCGQPDLLGGDGGGPITAISVEELEAMGLPELATGDLNGDGWLNEADIVEFLNGARPQPRPVPIEKIQTAPRQATPGEPRP